MAKKPSILPFNTVLDAVDRRDLGFYDRMSEEEKKEFKKKSFVFLRAASCVAEYEDTAMDYLLAVNMFANKGWFDLAKHPELQWKLLALCGMGSRVRHTWIDMSKKESRNGFAKILEDKYPQLNDEELDLLESKMDKKAKKHFLEDMGYDDGQINTILK